MTDKPEERIDADATPPQPEAKSNRDSNFVERAIEKTPGWVIGVMGCLICLSLSLNFANINFSEPINTISNAYADSIARQQRTDAKVTELILILEEKEVELEKKLSELQAHLNEFEIAEQTDIKAIRARLRDLEAVAHKPHRSGRKKAKK